MFFSKLLLTYIVSFKSLRIPQYFTFLTAYHLIFFLIRKTRIRQVRYTCT